MSGEIEVPETPNWLLELEAKRERRLKARLGHETGAGAPCLKCGDKCPGLDLHFWRKCCKVCKCSKEEHEVQDDDIYGWAQFQLLGSKPNKIKRKILLPGKKDELELDWAPKGNTETVDRYLKTLPPDQLPVKGSQAAQDRKQLLHKQIPIHDIDPALCHELTDDELNKMNDYIAHVKQSSVGVGQIVSLSSIIKGNLHTLNPSEAALIASRFTKGVPSSEVVTLHSQDTAKNLGHNMQKMSLKEKILPNYTPNSLNVSENVYPSMGNRIHDKSYSVYSNDENPALPDAQYSVGLGSTKITDIDPKYMQNPNFDPKKLPSQFVDRKLSKPNVPHTEQSVRNFNTYSDDQVPTVVPKSVRDLAFSTYDPTNVNPDELRNTDVNRKEALEKLNDPYYENQHLAKEIISKTQPSCSILLGDRGANLDEFQKDPVKGSRVDQDEINLDLDKNEMVPQRAASGGTMSSKRLAEMHPDEIRISEGYANPTHVPFGNRTRSPKKLSEIHPSNLSIDEDYVSPTKVSIGAIQDIDIDYPQMKSSVQGTNDFYEDYSPESIKEILNNIKLPDCHYCKKPFEENEFAVTIDRANVLFHARCFRCAGCSQPLADNVYFYNKETDNVYCGRDYAKVRGFPRCNACDELIFTKEYCLAENATFHLKHFCCTECDTPLADRHYTLDDGMPYCLPCFEQNKANRCSGCANVIKPDEVGCSLNGVHFHAVDACFACKVCRKPLMGQKLLLRNEKLYCSHECYGVAK